MIDRLEALLRQVPQVKMEPVHRFTPKLYTRELTMPAGTLLTSKIHKTEHQYIVSKGIVQVWLDGRRERIVAPYHGITQPGTRRVLYVEEETIWTTCHPTVTTDLVALEEELIEPREVALELTSGMAQDIEDVLRKELT